MSLFPVDVPNVPGVPAVNFSSIAGDVVDLLVGDALNLFAGALLGQQWGIFFFGVPVVLADSVVSFEYKRSASISDYPIEGGKFENYDKVQIPFDARFRFTAGGSLANRQALLNDLNALVGDTNIYDIVTPDAIYLGVNVTNIDYQQTAQSGVGLIAVDVWTLQVRVAPPVLLSNTVSSASASQVNDGTLQAVPASQSQVAQLPQIVGFPG